MTVCCTRAQTDARTSKREHTRICAQLRRCCAASELSKLISFTSTAPPPLSFSIYHHSFPASTQQPLQSSPHIYNKSIPLFASWGACVRKWLSGTAWYFAARLHWIINSQLSVVGVRLLCVCVCILTFHLSSREKAPGGNSWLNSGSQKTHLLKQFFGLF